MKITKKQLAQIVQEELSNTMTEGFGLVGALSAVKDAEDRGIADAQDDFARIQAGGKVLQIDTTEETQEEEDAYNKGWQNEMDRLKQTAADRKLNRPPPPETDADREAADAELDFEATYSEGTDKMKITKSKLAQIVQEELQAVTAEGYKAYKRDDISGFELGRQHALAVSQGEMAAEDTYAKRLSDKDYERGFDEQTKELESWDDERVSDPEGGDDDWMWENKITKSKLAQIVQEELKATLGEAGEDTDTLESHMLGREHALAVSKGEMAMEDTYLKRMRDEAYGAGFDDAMKKLDPQSNWDDEGGSDTDDSLNPDEPEGGLDDDWMWENKITKSQLAQLVQEELKATLSEAYSDTEYDPYWDEQAYDDARDEALRSAIDELLVELEDTPVPLDELIPSAPEDFDARDEKEWIEDGEEYLLGLVKAGDVVRVEGSADMPNLYVLAQ